MTLVEDRKSANKLTRLYNNTLEDEQDERDTLLKELLGSTGNQIYVEPPFRCDYGENIFIEENFYANFDCVMLDISRISIGKNCFMGPDVHIYTVNHPMDHTERNAGVEYGEPVKIGDNVWIGRKSIINPGVTIGNNGVIASGSVVTKNIPDSVLIGGNPARVIREL